MKAYELMLILDPSLDDDAQASVMDKAKGVITVGGGTVDDVDPWGKRQLAYEIDDRTDGIYVIVRFHADPDTVKELDRVLHITDQVLRSMIIRLEHVA